MDAHEPTPTDPAYMTAIGEVMRQRTECRRQLGRAQLLGDERDAAIWERLAMQTYLHVQVLDAARCAPVRTERDAQLQRQLAAHAEALEVLMASRDEQEAALAELWAAVEAKGRRARWWAALAGVVGLLVGLALGAALL
jgi:hypothetical protein